jgi:Zn-dependent protease with chaperone function
MSPGPALTLPCPATVDPRALRHLIATHELACREHPRQFARITAALAVAGFALIGLTALVALFGLAFAFWLWGHHHGFIGLVVGLGALSLLWSLASALLPRPAAQEGALIDASQAPRLFDLIVKLRAASHAPPIHEVRLTGELNAAIVQRPRLGLLGWHRNTLVVGLPLMLALDAPQCAAVLAHEMAHLQGGHGKLGTWVYRTRRSWWQLAQSRSRARFSLPGADLALQLFFQHFFPRFNARAMVLSRQQEREADAWAQTVVGRRALGSGLLLVATQHQYLQRSFWPEIWRASRQHHQPQDTPFRHLRLALKTNLQAPQAREWLRDALRSIPDPLDTHPSLRERLEQAEAPQTLPPQPLHSAAETLLSTALPTLTAQVEQAWLAAVREEWGACHLAYRQRVRWQKELAKAQEDGEVLDKSELLWWARLCAELDGAEAALPVLRTAVVQHANAAEARYLLALTLLELCPAVEAAGRQPQMPAQAVEAIGLLQQVANEGEESMTYAQSMAADPRWRLPAALKLERLLEQREDFESLKKIRARIRKLEQDARQAMEVLHDLEGEQNLVPPQLPSRTLKPLIEMLKQEHAVGRAWVWRKTSAQTKGWALHLLVIERSRTLMQPDTDSWYEVLRQRIELPLDWLVIDLSHPYWKKIARSDLVLQFKSNDSTCVYQSQQGRTAR